MEVETSQTGGLSPAAGRARIILEEILTADPAEPVFRGAHHDRAEATLAAADDETKVHLMREMLQVLESGSLENAPFRPSSSSQSIGAFNASCVLYFREIVRRLANIKLPWSVDDILFLLQHHKHLPTRRLLRLSTTFAKDGDARPAISQLWTALRRPFVPEWVVSDAGSFQQFRPEERELWIDAFVHADAVGFSAVPSDRWFRLATAIIEKIGLERFVQQAVLWVRQACRNKVVLPHGFLWYCARIRDAEAMGALAAYGEVCTERTFSGMMWQEKLRIVAERILREVGGTEAALPLIRLLLRRAGQSAAEVGQECSNILMDLGVPATEHDSITCTALATLATDYDELDIPSFGIDADGIFTRKIADWTVRGQIGNRGEIILAWSAGVGSTRKSVPARVKAKEPELLRQLKADSTCIRRLLSRRRDALEAMLRRGALWTFSQWNRHYLLHPLISLLTRRLIWQFGEGKAIESGCWFDGRLVNVYGHPIGPFGEDTPVRLWHPIDSDVMSIIGWRNWVQEHDVRQPFKQAFREIYLATDTERATNLYSNRFGGRILSQSKLRALFKRRGWYSRYSGSWCDGRSEPYASLSERTWNFSAQCWFVFIDRDYCWVSTDQVRFLRLGSVSPIDEVPKLIFSETLRDVDFVVSVGGIGSDSEWRDRGAAVTDESVYFDRAIDILETDERGREERCAHLRRILPGLIIADRCVIDGCFLQVRGILQNYRIHIGSSSVHAESDGHHICIVPNHGFNLEYRLAAEHVPLEGDAMLSLVLSKAFLLANDAGIKDPAISKQLGRA